MWLFESGIARWWVPLEQAAAPRETGGGDIAAEENLHKAVQIKAFSIEGPIKPDGTALSGLMMARPRLSLRNGPENRRWRLLRVKDEE